MLTLSRRRKDLCYDFKAELYTEIKVVRGEEGGKRLLKKVCGSDWDRQKSEEEEAKIERKEKQNLLLLLLHETFLRFLPSFNQRCQMRFFKNVKNTAEKRQKNARIKKTF